MVEVEDLLGEVDGTFADLKELVDRRDKVLVCRVAYAFDFCFPVVCKLREGV